MNYIVDIEGFNIKNQFIVKEFAYYRLCDFQKAQLLFSSPFPWKELSSKEKGTARYCERNLHRLPWSSGNINYQNRIKIFRSVFKSGDTIFVKGLQKQKYFESVLQPADVWVKNLEEYSFPSVNQIELKTPAVCPFHSRKQTRHCALAKVVKLASYWEQLDDVCLH